MTPNDDELEPINALNSEDETDLGEDFEDADFEDEDFDDEDLEDDDTDLDEDEDGEDENEVFCF